MQADKKSGQSTTTTGARSASIAVTSYRQNEPSWTLWFGVYIAKTRRTNVNAEVYERINTLGYLGLGAYALLGVAFLAVLYFGGRTPRSDD
jgi:hypothetical protein